MTNATDPKIIHDLNMYIDHGISLGHFLSSVVEYVESPKSPNDYYNGFYIQKSYNKAKSYADEQNRANLDAIIEYVRFRLGYPDLWTR